MNWTAYQKVKQLNGIIEQSNTGGIGLMTGLTGLAFYYYTLYEIFGEEGYAQLATKKMGLVFDRLNDAENLTGKINTSFCSGLAGIGYAAHFFSKRQLVEIDLSEDFAEIDEHLYLTALKQIRDLHYSDWMHGGLGTLKYFLKRSNEPRIEEYCHKIVNALLATIHKGETGSWIPNNFNRNSEKDEINFSLSHGQCGLLLILCKYAELFPGQEELRYAIEKIILFLAGFMRQINEDVNQHSYFPFSINHLNQSVRKYTQRLAWCYGDLNEVLLLYTAGKLFNNKEWLQLAEQVGHASTHRHSFEQTLLEDSHFCHGTSGLAAVYGTLYIISGDKLYGEASDYWVKTTLQQLEVDLSKNIFQLKQDSLIDGLAGVALVLASSLSNKPLQWKDVFLL